MTLAVVAIHCRGDIAGAFDWGHLTAHDTYLLLKASCSQVFNVAVPVFFFISGFLFFDGVDRLTRSVCLGKLRRRATSLLVPYILWNLLAIPLMLITMYGETLTGTRSLDSLGEFVCNGRWSHLFWDFYRKETPYPNLLGWHQLTGDPLLFTFWYVRDLMLITLLTPAIDWYVRKTGWWGFWVAAAVYVLRIWPYTIVSSQCLFFVFGAYWSMKRLPLGGLSQSVSYAVYGLTVCLTVLCVWRYHTYWGAQIDPAFRLAACFAVLCIARAVVCRHPRFRFLPLLTESSFFAYALHVVFAIPLGSFLMKAVFRGADSPVLLSVQFVATICTVYAICVATYAAMQRLFPTLLKWLCGQRCLHRT